jgi:hypothetical protein
MAASEIQRKYRNAIAVATALSLTANTQSAAQSTVLDNSQGNTNGNGATGLHCELKPTTAPSTATVCILFMHESQDNSNFSDGRPIGVFTGITTSNNKYYDLFLYDIPKYCKFSLQPVGYNMTINLSVMPFLEEAQ